MFASPELLPDPLTKSDPLDDELELDDDEDEDEPDPLPDELPRPRQQRHWAIYDPEEEEVSQEPIDQVKSPRTQM